MARNDQGTVPNSRRPVSWISILPGQFISKASA